MFDKIQGNLRVMSLPDVLQWISLAQKSGSVIFHRDKEKKVLFFRQGAVIGANSNSPQDKVGEILIRMEKLTREELDQGLRKQKETGELIGDIFLTNGIFTTKDFVAALERQATQIIYDLFSWSEGDFIFQEKLPKARTIPISIKVDFILMECMRRVDEWQKIKEVFPTLNIIVERQGEVPEEEGTDDQKRIRGLINGRNTILDICDQSPLNDFETCKYLYTLFQAQKVSKGEVRSPHEILEDDDVNRLVSRGRAFYQQRRFGDAIPFFERVLKIDSRNREADQFLSRAITAVQNELLESLGSPNAVLMIDKGFRVEEAQDLTAAEGFVLSRIDGKTTAKEVTYISGLSQTESCMALNRLLEKGIIRAGMDREEKAKKPTAAEKEFLDPKNKKKTFDLTDTSLSEIFLDLFKQRQTGVLQLFSSPIEIRVYFQEGAIVYGTSTLEFDRCGSIMLRKGKITEEQYQSVKALSEKDHMLQGNALVKLGIITPNDLIWLTKTKVEEILISLFGWHKGRVRFFEMDLGGLDIIHLKLSPVRVLMEGTWRYFEEEEIIKTFGSRDVLFDIVETPSFSRRDLDLAPNEREIFGLVNGTNGIDEIASSVGLEELEVEKVLFGLYSLGLIWISGRAEGQGKQKEVLSLQEMEKKWEEVRKQNYYRILGLDKSADARGIQKAFFAFTKKYHPDKCFRCTDEAVLDLMLQIFLAGKDAYEVLSSRESRKEYDAFLLQRGEETSFEDFQKYIRPNIEVGQIMKAEDFFNKAKGLLFSGRVADALEFLEKSLDLVPDDPDYNAYAGLALARLKKDYERAVEMIEKALETNSQNADYYAFLGEAHQRYNKNTKAGKAFAQALEINPRHIQAKREYQRLRSSVKR